MHFVKHELAAALPPLLVGAARRSRPQISPASGVVGVACKPKRQFGSLPTAESSLSGNMAAALGSRSALVGLAQVRSRIQ